ncbi:MAG: MotE family protein [Phycisphaerae bacterium]
MKRIIMLGSLTLMSFGIALGATWLWNRMSRSDQTSNVEPKASVLAKMGSEGGLGDLRPKEEKLDQLIADLKKRRQQYEDRERKLAEREKQLDIAREQLTEQARELDKLRLELTAPMTRVKEAIADLEKRRVVILKSERAQLQHQASIYDKMDSAAACEIVENMVGNGRAEDAAKILRFMSERNAGKLLAEMKDKAVADKLFEIMKRIQEEG